MLSFCLFKDIQRHLSQRHNYYKTWVHAKQITSPKVYITKEGAFLALKEYIIANTGASRSQFKMPVKLRSVEMANLLLEHVLLSSLEKSFCSRDKNYNKTVQILKYTREVRKVKVIVWKLLLYTYWKFRQLVVLNFAIFIISTFSTWNKVPKSTSHEYIYISSHQTCMGSIDIYFKNNPQPVIKPIRCYKESLKYHLICSLMTVGFK